MKTCSTENEYNQKVAGGRGAGINKTALEKDGGNVAIRQTLTEFKYAFFLKFFDFLCQGKNRSSSETLSYYTRRQSRVDGGGRLELES